MASESRGTVLLAFSANLAIAIAKTVAGVITLSSAMLAEAAHSWADTLNQIFLLTSLRKPSARPTRSTRSATARNASSGPCSPPSGSS